MPANANLRSDDRTTCLVSLLGIGCLGGPLSSQYLPTAKDFGIFVEILVRSVASACSLAVGHTCVAQIVGACTGC